MSSYKLLKYVFFLFIVSFWIFIPLLANINTRTVDDYDGLLIVWVLTKHIKSILGVFTNLFDGGIFYPADLTLLFSEFFLPSAVFAIPFYLLNLEPVAFYNFVIIFGHFLTSLVLFFWLVDMSKAPRASFLGTVLFSTSTIYLAFVHHVQVFSLYIFISALWLLWKFVKQEKIKYFYYFAFFLTVQVWESLLPVAWLGCFALLLFFKNITAFVKYKKQIVISLLVVFLLVSPLLLGYLQVSSLYQIARSIRDSGHGALSLDDLWGVYFSPSIYILFFLASLFVICKKDYKNKFFIMAVFSLTMSMGPVLKWQGMTFKLFDKYFIPLPYGIFYYLLPFFQAFRTPSRWIILFALFASVYIALWVAKYNSKLVSILLVFFTLGVALTRSRLPALKQVPQRADYPKVYKWLANQERDVVLEMPIYTWADEKGKSEAYRMLYSLEHGKKLVNGYSGFYPPEWEDFVREIGNFPNERFESLTASRRVDYVIFHKDEYEKKAFSDITSYLELSDVCQKDYEDDKVIVYTTCCR